MVEQCQSGRFDDVKQALFEKWLRLGMLSFGRPGTPGNRYAIEQGLKKRDSGECMKDFVDDIRPAVSAAGLQVSRPGVAAAWSCRRTSTGATCMGRIVDLCGEIAAAAEEGPEGLVLAPDMWDRLREEWTDDDIEDALGLVRDSLLLAELVESADSLSARLVEVLGAFGERAAFKKRGGGRGRHRHRRHRPARAPRGPAGGDPGGLPRRARRPTARGFDALQRRLAEYGIEDELDADRRAARSRRRRRGRRARTDRRRRDRSLARGARSSSRPFPSAAAAASCPTASGCPRW